MPKTERNPLQGRRWCYYATQGGESYEGAPHVCIVTADEPGYRLVNPDTDLGGTWPTMEAAERAADYWNEKLGVTEKDRDDIVTSSMRCFDAREAEQRRAGLRS